MKRMLVLLLCLGLCGCATLPGTIKESVSGFDKATEITMEPAWVGNGLTGFKLGLFRSSRMEPDKAILTAYAIGAYNFDYGESLHFNVDGEIISFKSIDSLTKIEMVPGEYNSVYSSAPYNLSSKRYEITKDFIKRLLDAKEVWGKISLSQTYVEAKFSVSVPMGAKNGFKKFYAKAWGKGESK